MRCLVFVLLMVSIECFGRTLYVGNIQIPLHKERVTIPSLHVRVDDEIVYAPLTTQSGMNTLHIEDEGIEYTVCKGEKQHVGHYWFVGNCLVDADSDVWLESTGTQYIDTGYKPWAHSFGFYFDLIIYDKEELYSVAGAYNDWQAGAFSAGLGGNYSRLNFGYDAVGRHNPGWRVPDNFIPSESMFVYGKRGWVRVENNNDYDGVKSTTVTTYSNLGPIIYDVTFERDMRMQYSFLLYGINAAGRETELADARMYRVKLLEYSVPVRDFVPVPAGLQIGNFVVPSNGMWDVVEQKFYGNKGTGNFMYGVGE